MEELAIRKFLASNGYGNGNGYGYGNGDGDGYGNGNGNGNGDGDGNGNGYGNGNGNGNGDGDGNGDGNGYGDGDGNGYGNGYGYGYGYGNGDGDGNGYGNGYGDGYGYGNGDGNGYGNGNGYGDGITLEAYRAASVHYIDTIPCVIKSIKGNIAAVDVIDTNSFLPTSMFVAKYGGLVAHGTTIKEAVESVKEKWAQSRSIEERMEDFKKTFKKGVLYNAKLFYKWHTTLTGSCQAGKDHWIEQQGINLKRQMTVHEFFNLTKNAYGGEVIKQLAEHYKE